MKRPSPPRWIERLLEWALPDGLSGQATLGDLAEEFAQRSSTSPLRAHAWYALQALSLVLYRSFTGSGADSPASDSDLLQDLRWSLRSMLRHPGFAIGIVIVLGLGLGATTAVYSVVDGTMENSTWWSEPDRTVAIWPGQEFSYGQLELYQEEQAVYRSLGGYSELAFALRTPDGVSRSVSGVLITPQLFRELAVQPALGRALTDEDGLFGVEPVVVIGEGLWRRAFGADPGIVGRTIDLNGRLVQVVGVQGATGAAPGGRSELWLPLVMDPRDDDFWKAQDKIFVGALRDGADLAAARADFAGFTDLLSDMFPAFYPDGWADGLADVARADEAQRRLVQTPLLLLLAGTGLLLLVTALNVGNLLLGRSIDRRKELAVRAALGAGRTRIVRQLLMEGFVLTVAGLVVGLATASLGGEWIARLFVEDAVVASSSIVSPAVLAFAAAVSVLAWLVLNGVPVAHFLRVRRHGLSMAPDSAAHVQRGLVTVQAALATLLLVTATLLVATVDNLRRVPLGFDPSGLVAVELSPPEDRVGSIPEARELYDRLVAEMATISGVQAAGLTGWLPLRKQAPSTPINLEANPVDPREAVTAPMQLVDPGFFQVMGIQAIEGRLLDAQDRSADAPSAIVVNETLARTLWPNGTAIGQFIAVDPHAWNSWAPVVGVVPDVRSGDIAGPSGPALYVSIAESPARDVTLLLRADSPSGALAPLIREAVARVDGLVPIRSVSDMDDVVRAAYATAWVLMGLLTVLALLATGLGAIGIYAVLAHHVSLRRREIGVRMALGANPRTVVGGVVRTGLLLAGLGVAIGSLAAAGSTRLLESLLFEVSALAPWAFVAPAVALTLAAAVAAWIPAARAGRLPPAEVLRGE